MEVTGSSTVKIGPEYKRYKPNIGKDPTGGMRFAPIRRVEYLSNNEITDENPYLDVKQRNDGQFVVVEKYPMTHRNRNVGRVTNVQASLANSGVKFRTIKPRWVYAINGEFLGRTDALKLPSVDLGWTKKSKCGSMDQYYHKPGGGTKRIFSESRKWNENAKSKVGSLENVSFGKFRSRSYPSYENYGLYLPDISPRFEAQAHTECRNKIHYIPGKENVKPPRNPRYEETESHVRSLDNMHHISQGGNVILPNYRKDWKEPTESKVRSLEFIHHQPGGGNFQLPQIRKQKWTVKSKVGSLDNIQHEPDKHRKKVPHFPKTWKGHSKIGSLDNISHKPAGGQVSLPKRSIRWRGRSKVNSKPPIKTIYEREESDYSLDSLD
ncbi:hypothetical protein LOTGIDRAFT_163029 [Lottia gigantea]|uniref:Microtubule-associated protein n=1 Tax=Lottia gigantea TaxID=225164 RepID=V4BSN5_LOTGI|nr:hypothetical protein LOTGIDRAFT_163029 [Lottia gigantea]ESO92024.1 hypothetical protein LOTGIDRAFT_163029 [Lottia gigantea]